MLAIRSAAALFAVATAVLGGIGDWKSGPGMPRPRGGLQIAFIRGRVLVAGGSFWNAGTKRWSARADWFDPQARTWSAAPPLPAPRSDAATVATGAEVYLFGGTRGSEALDDALVFRDGAWHAVPEMKLPEPRIYASAAHVGSRLYLGGGVKVAGHYQTASAALWEFDLANPTAGWTALPPIPGPARFNFAMVANHGNLCVFAGGGAAGDHDVRNLSDAYRLDLKTRKWTGLHDLPEPNRAMAAGMSGAEILLAGGYTSDYQSQTWFYSTQSDSWRQGAPLPHGIADGRLANAGNRIVFVGGEAGSQIRAPWTLVADSDTVRTNIEYARAGGKPLLLDLYLPAGHIASGSKLPVILSIHGGGWSGGSKDASPGLEFTRRGYAVASVSYRLTGEAEFPAQIEDCKAALRWLRANAGRFGLDPGRVAAWGASAGGHLAALLGTSGEELSKVQAVVDYFGPIDVVAWHRDRGDSSSNLVRGPFAETAERLRAANPLTFLKPGAPPFLIAQGAEDPLVPPSQSELLYHALRQAGVRAEFHLVPGAGHSVRQMNLDDRVDEFLRESLNR